MGYRLCKLDMNQVIKCVLYFLLFLLVALICFALYLAYLIHQSKPTFTRKDLEKLVHTAVKEFDLQWNEGWDNDDKLYEKAVLHFDKTITESYKDHTGIVEREKMIEMYRIECLLKFIASKFHKRFPQDAIDSPRWAYNELGGSYARSYMLLANPCEYVTIWGTVLAKHSVFSGYYAHFLNEGDVMICGTMFSADPESELCYPRRYEFGQTSELKATRRREYSMSDNCYMLSYGLHDHSNLMKTMFVGVIFPYLFQNNDTKSFNIQMGDAYQGFKKWFIKQHQS